jgi:putative adhesin
MRTLVLLAVGLVAAVPVQAQQEWTWNGRLRQGQTVEIKGVNGNVRATFATGDQIQVRGVKRAERSDPDEVKIEVVEHADGVTICAVYPTPSRSREENSCQPGSAGHMNTQDNDVKVNFTVSVPAGVRLSARTVNGEVEVGDLRSDVDAATVNGSVRVSTTGLAEASTVNGSVDVTMGRADWTGELEFRTVNGGITVYLPATLNTEFSASTVNGSIDTDWPITVQGRLSPRRIRGTIGSGGRQLDMDTVNGSIAVRKRTSS